jgi:hypothetical protein
MSFYLPSFLDDFATIVRTRHCGGRSVDGFSNARQAPW